MTVHDVSDRPRWYAICTNPQQEDRACFNLQAWGVECFNPKIKESRRNQFTGIATIISKPLFPRYIFSRFQINSAFHKISFTRGIHRIVSFDGRPTPIDDDVIALIQSRVSSDGFVKIGESLKPGDMVRVKDGPWKALTGVVEREFKTNERITLLLESIKYQSRLTIESHWVEKISSQFSK